MITNDEELAFVRKQLARVEAALDSLRQDVKPKNERTYQVMAVSYVDAIQELRTQVEAYLGVGLGSALERAPLVISLEGPEVALGRTSSGVVTRIIDAFRRGLQSLVEAMENAGAPSSARRKERWIERICDLPLAGLAPGSVQVMFERPQGDGLFSEEEQKALDRAVEALFDGLEWAEAEPDAPAARSLAQLSEATRWTVLKVVSHLLPPQSGPVERLGFQRRSGQASAPVRRAALTARMRRRVRDEIARLSADQKYTEVDGVVRSIDLDARTFVLRDRPEGAADLPCEYGEGIEEAVKESLDRRVRVSGVLEYSRIHRRPTMAADDVETLAAEAADESSPPLMAPPPSSPEP